jgi:hypothetical protein
MVHLLAFLAVLLFGGAAQAQCIGALQSGNNLADVCSASTSRTNIGAGTGNGTVTEVATGAGMTGGPITTTGTVAVLANVRTVAIAFVIDGGGAAISTGIKGDLEVTFACTITAARLFADQSGSIVVDIWKDTYAQYPPIGADSITASAKPTIASTTKAQDTTLTGWTTSIVAGDILRFNVDSVATLTRVTVSLTCLKA